MDKNTLTGLLLMAAVMFGFMYCNKTATRDSMPADTPEKSEGVPAEAAAGAVMNFAPGDSTGLVAAIRSIGVAEDSTDAEAPQAWTFRSAQDDMDLRYDSAAGLSGTVAGTDVNELLSGRTILESGAQSRAVNAVHDLINRTNKYQGFARYLGGEERSIVLENELVKIELSTRGAMLSSVELKKYADEVRADSGSHVVLFTPETAAYSWSFTTADQRLDTREFVFEAPESPVMKGDTAIVAMTLRPAQGAEWTVRYSLAPDSYVVNMELEQKGMQSILPASTASMDFRWHQAMMRNEQGRTFEERNSAIMYDYVGDSPDEMKADDLKELNGKLRWVAFKNQFFSTVLIARTEPFTTAQLQSAAIKDSPVFLKDMNMEATLPYSNADGITAAFDFYVGPNDYPLLSHLEETLVPGEDLSLTRLIPLGWGLFRWVNVILVIPVFTFLGKFISSYGLIIFLLTVFIKLILFPFTYKSYKSQARMRVLAPEIKEINDKYPGQENAMTRQQKTMELYSKAGASPFSGCLPMLLQMPVLIAMFSFFPSAIELRGQSFLWAHNLAAPDSVLTLPFNIPFYGNHVSLFCLLMTIVNVVYMHISMQNQPGGQGMPGMKMMTYIMPVMFLFIFNDYASGLSYYYFLSLLITIIQTWAVRHFFVDEKKVREEMLANARKPRKKSGWMARLEEAQRQQQAMLREQQKRQGKGRR